MKRETAFQALSGLDDHYIAETVRYMPPAAGASERKSTMKSKRIITLALAAALILALGVTAYALGIISMDRRVPDPEETFRISWEENASGYIEWSDAKLAVTFPETAESREIEIRPGWLPEEMSALKSDAWLGRFTAERLALLDGPESVPAYADMTQPLLIETYSMSMFNNGGALLLLYYTPGEIVEEHWDEQGVDVMRFHCTQDLPAVPEYNVPARTLEQDIILLSNTEEGWVVRICGEIGMEQLLEVARNLEIRETGKVLRYEDFDGHHYTFMDGGVG